MEKIVTCNGIVVANHVNVANSFFTRLRGLLGKKQLKPGEGLLITKCSSVHCFFMKFTIDVAYLSEDFIVLGTETLLPWQLGKWVRGTKHTLELEEGKVESLIKKGDRLDFEDTK